MAAVMYAGGLALSGFFGWPLMWCIIGTGAFAGGAGDLWRPQHVAWTGVFTAIVKIGGVHLADDSGAQGDDAVGRHRSMAFVWSIQKISATAVSGKQALDASRRISPIMAHITGSRFPAAGSSADPWTGTFFGFLAVGVWYAGDEPVHRPAGAGRARYLARLAWAW
jgi:hypothetical protein